MPLVAKKGYIPGVKACQSFGVKGQTVVDANEFHEHVGDDDAEIPDVAVHVVARHDLDRGLSLCTLGRGLGAGSILVLWCFGRGRKLRRRGQWARVGCGVHVLVARRNSFGAGRGISVGGVYCEGHPRHCYCR
jgi:hypothetical protein